MSTKISLDVRDFIELLSGAEQLEVLKACVERLPEDKILGVLMSECGDELLLKLAVELARSLGTEELAEAIKEGLTVSEEETFAAIMLPTAGGS